MLDPLHNVQELRQTMQTGQAAIGSLVTLADPLSAEILATSGLDFIVIDTEHAAHPTLSVRTILQATSGTSSAVIVRPRVLDAELMAHYLDLGAGGILAPKIETSDDARMLAEACRYPPQGRRGFGPRRASAFGLRTDEYLSAANQAILCIGIVESAQGAKNVDDIAAQDGLDAVVIGPMDLSLDLGVLGEWQHPRYLEAVETIESACRRNGKFLGVGCNSVEHAIASRDAGYNLLIATADDNLLRDGAAQVISSLR